MSDTTDFYFENYADWHQTITELCKTDLTPEYARSRITALQDSKDRSTQEFVSKYGEAYLHQVIQWYEQAERQD